MKNLKKKQLVIITCIILAVGCAIGLATAAFAYVRSTSRGYPLKITSTFVAFTLNGNTYLNDIGSKDLTISKGQQCDFVLQVGLRASASAYVDYRVYFDVVNADPSEGSEVAFDALTSAIEVYVFNGNQYEYVCRLSELDEKMPDGTPKHYYAGELITDLIYDIPYRLVYSPETSAEYDRVAEDGKFIIKAYADELAFVTTASEEHQYIYVNDIESFASYFEDPASVGKTIVLNSALTLTENLTSAGKVSINLNGFTLNTAGHTLTIGSAGTESDTICLTAGLRTVTESGTTRQVKGSVTGSGSIVLPEGVFLVSPNLADHVTASLPDDVLAQFVAIVSERAALLDGGKDYFCRTATYPGDDLSFLFAGLEYLMGTFDGETVGSGNINLAYDENYLRDGFVKLSYDADTEKFYIDEVSNEMTSRYFVLLNFTRGAQSASVPTHITLQGTSAFAIAEMLKNELPEVISRSTILKTYDNASAANAEWLVYDGMGGLLFDGNGIFRPCGMAALKEALDAAGKNYYEDIPIEMYLKVSKATDTCTFYINTVAVRPFSAEELTELIYNDIAIAVGDSKPYRFADHLDAEKLARSGLTSITAEYVGEEEDAHYVISTAEGETYPKLSLKGTVDTNFVGKDQVKITFTYANGETHVWVRDVDVLGDAKYITAYDVSTALQVDFTTNPYVDGDGYSFTARSVLSPLVNTGDKLERIPVFVDYEVATEAAKNFISVTYDFCKVDLDDMDDFFAYFTYDADADCYVFAKKGEDGKFDPSETYYQRLAVVEVLPAKVSYTDTEIAIVNANVYTLDTTGNNKNFYYSTAGTFGGKRVVGVPHTMVIDDKTVNVYYDPASGSYTQLTYPLTLEIEGIITNSREGVEDYNLYIYLRDLYDGVLNGVDDGIITAREAKASWEDVKANLARKGKSYLIEARVGEHGEWTTDRYFTNEPYATKTFSTPLSLEKLLGDLKDADGNYKTTGIQKIGNYITFFKSSSIPHSTATYIPLFVLKKSNVPQFSQGSTYVSGGSWGKLKLEGSEVVAVGSTTSNDLWDLIEVKLDKNGMVEYPDDYNSVDYLPGIFLAFFETYNNADGSQGTTAYNRYVEEIVDGKATYTHRFDNNKTEYNNKLSRNLSLVGPFFYSGVSSTYSHECLNLDNVPVATLSGIENFPYLKGLSLYNSGVADIAPLEELVYLEYLNISADDYGVNTVTNLSPLKYLDRLEVLKVERTNVTSLDEIRYLQALRELDISNTSVLTFDAVADMQALQKLTLSKNGLTNTEADMYNLALAYLNARNRSEDPLVVDFQVINENRAVNLTDDILVAAAVMHDLERFNRVNRMLYLPLVYNYNGRDYKLEWFCSDADLISIDNHKNEGRSYASYSITSPLFDTPLRIEVQIDKDGDGMQHYTARRVFNITLEVSDAQTKYIYDYKTDGYVEITEDLIPDPILRNLIFTTFNKASDETGYGGSDPSYVISKTELENFRTDTVKLDWSDRGITDLRGIEYLAPLFDQDDLYLEFNLAGNDIEDLSPLTAVKLNVLILGGKEYDLSQLAGKDGEGNALLSSLRALDVHECVNISKEESLKKLYRIYANNPNVYIYKDSAPTTTYYNDPSVAWNPYDELMAKALHAKKSVYAFASKGDTANIFGEINPPSFTFKFYDNEITFAPSGGTMYQATSCFGYDNATGKVTYETLNAWEESAMLCVLLSASDGHEGWNVAVGEHNSSTYEGLPIAITHDWYVELIALDPGRKISVYHDGKWQPISDLFSSYDVLKLVLDWFYGTSGVSNKNKTKLASLDALTALIGDGTDLSATEMSYYLDSNGTYYITSKFLKNAATKATITLLGRRISGEEITYGLELLPGITRITYQRDAYMGDGSHLENIEVITCDNTSLDLGRLSVDLPKLTELTLLSFSSFTTTAEAMRHLPNLITLGVGTTGNNQVERVTDWSFLSGLINDDGTTSLKNLTIKNFTVSATATDKTPTAQLTPTDWGYVYDLYCAVEKSGHTPVFKINTGSLQDITRSGNALYVNGVQVSLAEQSDLEIETKNTYTDAEGYEFVTDAISDLGLKIGTQYRIDNPVDPLASGSVVTLPETTYEDLFGIEYADGTQKRAYPITWKLYQSTGNNAFTSQTVSGDVTLSGDSYSVLVGTVSCDGKPSYSYLYPFVVGNGDQVYSKVEDPNLRKWLFANFATIGGAPAPEITSLNLANESDKIGEGISDRDILQTLSARGLSAGALPKSNRYYVTSLAGLDTVVEAAGRADAIKHVDLSHQQMLTVGELSALTNLETLLLSNTSVKLTDYTVPATLTTLRVDGDACFGVDDLSKLKNTSLTTIGLYNTGVSARYEVIETLLTLDAMSNESGTISLAWRLSDDMTVSKADLSAFRATVTGSTFQRYVSKTGAGFELSDFAGIQVISGHTVAMPTASYNLLSNFDIADRVKTVLTVQSNENAQLFIYHPAYCVKSGAGTGYIGLGTDKPAGSVDTELLAYLFAKGVLAISEDNTHLLGSGTYKITSNVGIKELPSGNIDRVHVTISENTLAGASEQPAASTPGIPVRAELVEQEILDLVYAAVQSDLIDEIFKTLPKALTYSGNSYTVKVTIPQYIYVEGTKYSVDVEVACDVGTHTYQNGELTMTFGMELNTNETYVGSYSVTIQDEDTQKYRVEISNNIVDPNVFQVTRLAIADTSPQDNFLVEVQYDAENRLVYMVDDDGNITVSATVTAEPKKLYWKNGAYFTTEVDGYESWIYYVNASTFILSGRLRTYIYWLSEFNNGSNANYRPFVDGSGTLFEPVKFVAYDRELNEVDLAYGKVLLNDYALKLVDFRHTMIKGFGSTSMEGLQMFDNMESLFWMHNAITDLTPIAGLHLKSFQYLNSQGTHNFLVTDFTPLLEGSRETLEIFGYNGYGNAYVTDLSFLTDCPNLKAVYFGTRYANVVTTQLTDGLDSVGNGFTSLKALPFQYVLASLYNKGVYCYATERFDLLRDGLLTLDKTQPFLWEGYYAPDTLATDPGALASLNKKIEATLYPIVPAAYDRQAADILNNLDSARSPNGATLYSQFAYGDRYLLHHYVTSPATSEATVYLPATINYNGEMSLIQWVNVTENVTDIQYVVQNSDGSFSAPLSEEDARNYVATIEFFNDQKAGLKQIYAVVTISGVDNTNVTACDYTRLTCNIMLDDYFYQRMVTLKFISGS